MFKFHFETRQMSKKFFTITKNEHIRLLWAKEITTEISVTFQQTLNEDNSRLLRLLNDKSLGLSKRRCATWQTVLFVLSSIEYNKRLKHPILFFSYIRKYEESYVQCSVN